MKKRCADTALKLVKSLVTGVLTAILKLLSRYTRVKQISKHTVANESQVSPFRERT